MVKVLLKPLDEGLRTVEIPQGKTILGRGPFLNCADKKVSRNHAVLELKESGELSLTSIHVNPCFYTQANSTDTDGNPKVLKQHKTLQLSPGDVFSLLPQSYKYKVVVSESEDSETPENIEPECIKDEKELESCNGGGDERNNLKDPNKKAKAQVDGRKDVDEKADEPAETKPKSSKPIKPTKASKDTKSEKKKDEGLLYFGLLLNAIY